MATPVTSDRDDTEDPGERKQVWERVRLLMRTRGCKEATHVVFCGADHEPTEKLKLPTASTRDRFGELVSAIITKNPAFLKVLNGKGETLATKPLEYFYGERQAGEAGARGSQDEKFRDTIEEVFRRHEDALDARASNERKDFALAIDRQGARMVEAFNAGAAAANSQQEQLIKLIAILARSFAEQITGTHNLAVELAQARVDAANAEGGEAGALHGQNGQQILALLAAGLLKGGGDETKPNGKG